MRIHHVALRTPDVARLERFYSGVLAMAVLRRDENRGSVWLDASGVVLMIEPAGSGEPQVPPLAMDLVAFAVEDKERWRAGAGNGIVIEDETAHTLYFRDPDGRRIGVSDYRF